MEIFSRFTGLLCGESTGHRCIPLTKANYGLMFYLICTWTNGWVNNRDASDLRHHRTHYDATVIKACTVVLIKFLPYSGATAQTRSVALRGVSGSYGQAPAQQGMSGLVRETSHLWPYSSPSPSLQPILREPATSILIVLYTFECIMWVATESLWKYVQGNK